jgi:dynein heavy chain
MENYVTQFNTDQTIYSSQMKRQLNIILFKEACIFVSKISRVVRMESGNCLVLTYGGDGHKSFSRLSAFLAGIKLYEIYINKDYNYKSWQDDLKKVLLIAGNGK